MECPSSTDAMTAALVEIATHGGRRPLRTPLCWQSSITLLRHRPAVAAAAAYVAPIPTASMAQRRCAAMSQSWRFTRAPMPPPR
jgi:hypothetical protein